MNDIVIGSEGTVKAVVIGVGGFLGIGEKSVAIDMAKLDWAEANGDRWLVTNATKEQLQALPTFDRTPYDPAPAPVASNDPMAPATAPADGTTAVPTPADGTAAAPAPAEPAVAENPAPRISRLQPMRPRPPQSTRSALTEIPSGELKAEELIGTKVYGANDENIGEISDIILSQDGKVDAVILDVGGFLGMGEKPVAIGFEKLAFMTDKDGKKYLYTKFTKEQLEAQPAYDKGTYTEKRDKNSVCDRAIGAARQRLKRPVPGKPARAFVASGQRMELAADTAGGQFGKRQQLSKCSARQASIR